jgi:hypothetical protein
MYGLSWTDDGRAVVLKYGPEPSAASLWCRERDNCCRQLLETTTGTAEWVLKYRAKMFGSIAVQFFL